MDFPATFPQFVQWGFFTLIAGGVAFATYSIREDFKETTKSLQILALTVAQLTERLSSFEKSLDRLDERLEKLENLRHN